MKKETQTFLEDKKGAALIADNKGKDGEYVHEETICSPEFPQNCIDSDRIKDNTVEDME